MDLQRIKESVHTPAPAPLHVRLRRAIHAQIVDGTLQPGASLPSERALQQAINVSRATVRQAISALIQAGLLQSVPGTGTFVMEPPHEARRLGLIGLVVSTPNFHFFYPQLAAAFNAVVRGADYGMVMALHNEQAAVLDEIVTDLLAQHVVALALTPPRYGDFSPAIERLQANGVPLLFIGRPSPVPTVDSVSTDNFRVGFDAARHLIELGHRQILHLGMPDYSTGRDRAAGYEQAMQEAGLEPHIVVIDEPRPDSHYTPPPVPSVIEDHLARPAYDTARACFESGDHDHITAVFCFNDVAAMGTYKALRDLGRRIPNDISLVSVDNLVTVQHFEVPLTTFALPGDAIGRHGAELLLRRLGGDLAPSQDVRLPAPLINRLSSAPLA